MTGGGCVEWQRGSRAAGDYSLGARRKQDSTEIFNCITLLPLQTCNTYLCCDEAVSLENRMWTGMQPESVPTVLYRSYPATLIQSGQAVQPVLQLHT